MLRVGTFRENSGNNIIVYVVVCLGEENEREFCIKSGKFLIPPQSQ